MAKKKKNKIKIAGFKLPKQISRMALSLVDTQTGRQIVADALVAAATVLVERYPTLFSPLQIGPVTVRNRIMQTAHVKLFTANGVDSERNVAYQVERAKGGAGLLITGNRLVHPTSTTGRHIRSRVDLVTNPGPSARWSATHRLISLALLCSDELGACRRVNG